jgi:hypothetical protein
MDVDKILISCIKTDYIDAFFNDIVYIRKISNDYFSTKLNEVYVIYNDYKVEISYYSQSSILHYVSFEKINDNNSQSLFLGQSIEELKRNMKDFTDKDFMKVNNNTYRIGKIDFIFDEAILESIFFINS